MLRRRFVLSAALALACACSDSSGPGPAGNVPGIPGIKVLAGGGQADTVDAVLTQGLVIEVRDSLGELATQQVVRFDAQIDSAAAQVMVSDLSGQTFTPLVAETTDVQGEAAILVRLAARSGTSRLRVSVPKYGWVDTVAFTVQPGHAFHLYTSPDTVVSVGGAFQLRAFVGDRHGNARPGGVTYQTSDVAAAVSAAGMVAATAAGQARIVVTASGFPPDTILVSVLPVGTIAASTTAGVMVVNLDGTGYTVLPIATADYQGRYPSWISPTAIAAMDGRYYADLLRVGTGGTVQYLVPASDTVVLEVWPQASRDGAWIYFGGLVPGPSTSDISIWRIQPGGTGLERVSPPNTGFGDTFPSPSPDGTRVAVATTRGGNGFQLAIISLATRQLTTLPVLGLAPRWAPVGDSIAYLNGAQEIWLVHSGGTGARRVSLPGRAYYPGIDWSPDRRWIIAGNGTGLDLIEVATGMVLPVPALPGNPTQPSWKP